MKIDLRGRHFLKEADFTAAEFNALVDLAGSLKVAGRNRTQRLQRRNIALIFEKTSTRTRCAFEVAAHRQGAQVTYIDSASSQLGHKESVADTAKVLSRMFDGIEFRGGDHAVVEELAANSRVPVYNGLTDQWHPTQMLADILTMREHSTSDRLSYAYLGDARNNVAHSLLVTGALLGADVRIGAPTGLQPAAEVLEIAQRLAATSGATLTVTAEARDAVEGAEFVHTDVWVSMGEPAAVWAERVELLRPYRVDEAVMRLTGRPDAKFMHCLPAYHDTKTKVGAEMAAQFGLTDGIEVSGGLFDSPANLAFDQAENRLHTIEAVLVATLADEPLDRL